MSRIAIWVLSTISGVLLVSSCLLLATSVGYSSSGSCTGDGCQLVLSQMEFNFAPLLQVAGPFLLLAVLIGLPAWIASPIMAARREDSSKTPILILSIVAAALLAMVVYVLLTSPALATPVVCFRTTNQSSTCVTGSQARTLAALGVSVGPLLLSIIAGLPAWIIGLTRTLYTRRWGWFVAILLLSPVAGVLYGFLGPEHAATTVSAPPATPPEAAAS